MSATAVEARRLADSLLPRERRLALPLRSDVETALTKLRTLQAIDAHDEVALGEAAEMMLRLRDIAVEG